MERRMGERVGGRWLDEGWKEGRVRGWVADGWMRDGRKGG